MELEVCKGADAGHAHGAQAGVWQGGLTTLSVSPALFARKDPELHRVDDPPFQNHLAHCPGYRCPLPAAPAHCPLPGCGCPWDTGSCSHGGMKHARSSTVGCTHHRRAGLSRG